MREQEGSLSLLPGEIRRSSSLNPTFVQVMFEPRESLVVWLSFCSKNTNISQKICLCLGYVFMHPFFCSFVHNQTLNPAQAKQRCASSVCWQTSTQVELVVCARVGDVAAHTSTSGLSAADQTSDIETAPWISDKAQRQSHEVLVGVELNQQINICADGLKNVKFATKSPWKTGIWTF